MALLARGHSRKTGPGRRRDRAGSCGKIAMYAKLSMVAVAALFATTALAQTPAAQLAKPPAEARHFIIESTGGKHGDSWSWVAVDGTRMARETWNLRGQVWDQDYTGKA